MLQAVAIARQTWALSGRPVEVPCFEGIEDVSWSDAATAQPALAPRPSVCGSPCASCLALCVSCITRNCQQGEGPAISADTFRHSHAGFSPASAAKPQVHRCAPAGQCSPALQHLTAWPCRTRRPSLTKPDRGPHAQLRAELDLLKAQLNRVLLQKGEQCQPSGCTRLAQR